MELHFTVATLPLLLTLPSAFAVQSEEVKKDWN
jgi:hypothetical protein